MEQNIKCGNSLIEDESVAGSKAFKWADSFKDIVEDGGFDVVIGNPPYVRVDNLKKSDKAYWKTTFCSAQGKYDLYYLFIESAFRWLRTNGKCGFIVPNKFCAASSAKYLREIIVNNSCQCAIISVSQLPIFKDAANYPVILLLNKGEKTKRVDMGSVSDQKEFLNRNFVKYVITRNDLTVLPSKIFPININQEQFDLAIKLLRNSEKLVNYIKIHEGLRIPAELENPQVDDFEIVKQFQFDKWSPIARGSHISKFSLSKTLSPSSTRYLNILKHKILIAEDALSITATTDYDKRVPQGGVYFGVLENDLVPIEYIIGLLNSKLLSFVYKILFGGMHMGGGYLRYRTKFLESLPVQVAKQDQLVKLVNERLSRGRRFYALGDKLTDEKVTIERETKEIDDKLDACVYEIYGLTDAEKEIVENSLK